MILWAKFLIFAGGKTTILNHSKQAGSELKSVVLFQRQMGSYHLQQKEVNVRMRPHRALLEKNALSL